MEENLTLTEKNAIKDDLLAYCGRYPSRNVASASLKGVSAATVSAILNNKHTSISDAMWLSIAWQVKANADGWQVQETTAYQKVMFALGDAQEFKNVSWIIGDAGCGKTTAARLYTESHREVYYILCSEDMRRNDFIREMARQIGIPTDALPLHEILEMITSTLAKRKNPLLVFDEGDKLIDSVFTYFISIYNQLEGRAGIVFLSTDYIRRRMTNGLRYNRKGYKEINSRICRKFVELQPSNDAEVYAICMSNGLTNEPSINRVIKDANESDFDLRRVKRKIHAEKRILTEKGRKGAR